MPPIDMPMNTAHQHAANADDFLAQGYLIPASEEHYKAAEAYMAAAERTNEETVKRTLKMLYNDHCKAGKELQRKIAKLREENKDPTLPQKPEPSKTSSTQAFNYNVNIGMPRSAPSPPPNRPMSDSQNAASVDESFMLLGGQRSDPGDAFNQFWNIMQGMLDNLSQPVAFATAPLGGAADNIASTSAIAPLPAHGTLPRDGSLSSDTDIEEPMVSRLTRRIGLSKDKKVSKKRAPQSQEPQAVIDLRDEEFDEFDVGERCSCIFNGRYVTLSQGDELSESFCLIPSGAEPSIASLKKENATLRAELEAAQKRLTTTERVLQLRKDQDQQLRDSIVMARREAQRAMGASTIGQRPAIDLNSMNINVSPVSPPMMAGIASSREAGYTRRIRELEDEIRQVRVENEKHKLTIVKFRERWDKLKESAKRKKEAKVAAESSPNGVRERIVEEPEAEQELDEGN